MASQNVVCRHPGCGRWFSSDNELTHHEITHLFLKVSCYGCSRKFRRYPDMIIHLEGHQCPSGISIEEVNRSAAMCFQWKKYLDKPFREDLLAGNDSYRSDPGQLPFKCPRCTESFPLLSSLFLHVWSPSCTQGLNGGSIKKLKRWLWKRRHWRKRLSGNEGVRVDVEDVTGAFKVMALHASF